MKKMDISLNYKPLKLFVSTKKIIDKTKSDEHVLGLEIIEAVLVYCNL